MSQKSLFCLNEETKNLISEISAITGYAQNIVKEVIEFMLIDWAIKIADHPDEYADLNIPYLGTVSVKYADDELMPSGELRTKVDVYTNLNDSFKKLVGDIYDQGISEIVPMIKKKYKGSVLVASANDRLME